MDSNFKYLYLDHDESELRPDASPIILENILYRKWAVGVLSNTDPQNIEILLDLLADLQSPISGGAGEQIGAALRELLDGSEPYLRFCAAAALVRTDLAGERGHDVEQILTTGLEAEDSDVRRSAADALGRMAGSIGDTSIQRLTTHLRDRSRLVRAASVHAIGRLPATTWKRPEVFAPLEEFIIKYDPEGDIITRRLALAALAEAGNQYEARRLVDNLSLSSTEEPMRREALGLLILWGALEAMCTAILREVKAGFRRILLQAISGYVKSGEHIAVTTVLSIAQQDPDIETQCLGIRATIEAPAAYDREIALMYAGLLDAARRKIQERQIVLEEVNRAMAARSRYLKQTSHSVYKDRLKEAVRLFEETMEAIRQEVRYTFFAGHVQKSGVLHGTSAINVTPFETLQELVTSDFTLRLRHREGVYYLLWTTKNADYDEKEVSVDLHIIDPIESTTQLVSLQNYVAPIGNDYYGWQEALSLPEHVDLQNRHILLIVPGTDETAA